MPPPDLPTETAPERVPDDLAEAGVYATNREGFDHGLVVLAMGLPYWLVPEDAGYRLLVEPQAIAFVREQLACFDRESVGWPPPPLVEKLPARKPELITPLLWVLALLAAFWGQGEWPAWEDAGVLDAQALFGRGEWWRPGTALFLHADLGHLVSNAISGFFVFSAVLTAIGRRRGWLLLALAAVVGNVAAAALHYAEPYRSLGASTAVFAGLGLLTGRAIRIVTRRSDHPRRWRPVFVPLASGLILLGLYGAGELHVDVVAHCTGFAAGLVLGLVAAERP